MITLSGSLLSASSASTDGDGGGVMNGDTMTIVGCTLSGNTAGQGGGIMNLYMMTVDNCTLSGNTAGIVGGGIANFDTLTVRESIYSTNTPDNICGPWIDLGGNTSS